MVQKQEEMHMSESGNPMAGTVQEVVRGAVQIARQALINSAVGFSPESVAIIAAALVRSAYPHNSPADNLRESLAIEGKKEPKSR